MYLDHLHGSAGGSRFKEGSVDCISAPVDIYSLNVDEAEDPLYMDSWNKQAHPKVHDGFACE